MARPMKPLVKSGGCYPFNRWTPLVYPGGYTTMDGVGGGDEPTEKTVSGSIVHFTDALAAPLKSLSVAVEPIQAGSGDPSPDNVRPISGWDAVNIWVKPTHDTSANPTATIQLGETVYGGQLDVTAGKMVVDRAMVDLGTLSFFKSSSVSASGGSLFSIPVSSVGVGMAERVRNAPNTMISDAYKTAASDAWWANQTPDFGMSVNTSSLFVADSRYSTAADFKAAVSGVQLVYELATPIEITLTPTQIEALQGNNTVWSDAGDVTVTYLADGNASDAEALGILLGGRYTPSDDVTDKEALGIILGGTK